MISAYEFRRTMRHLAAGVTVVATEYDGKRAGLTVTAVCSFSADPPMLLVCIGAQASAHELIKASGRFSVNLLAQGHESIARLFSGGAGAGQEKRFSSGTWSTLATGAPVLEDALISLDCRVTEIVSLATHTVFIGTVAEVTSGIEKGPLIYAHGSYGTFSPV